MMDNVSLIVANSLELQSCDLPTSDFAFVDGGHEFHEFLSDACLVISRLVPGGVVVFDDCAPIFPGVQRLVSLLESISGIDRIGAELHNVASRVIDRSSVIDSLHSAST